MKKKILNHLYLATAISFALSFFPLNLHAESSVQEEITVEESGFDENAHGEVIEMGSFGELRLDPKPKYKLFEDGMLYIYGEGRSGEGPFFEHLNITEIYIENGFDSIEYATFEGCPKLEKIRIPESVTYIGDYAFNGCTSLQTLDIPYGVLVIGMSAFNRCSGISKVEIPDSVSFIGERAFYGCSGIKEITIPDSVTSIGENAFQGCSGIKEIAIPNSVTHIGGDAFAECGDIKIIGGINSEAANYAKKYNLKFEALEENHSYDAGKIEITPTCTGDGQIKYTCSDCGYTYTETIPATGHNYSNWITVKNATIFQNGKEKTICTTCGKILQERIREKLAANVKLSKKKLTLKVGKTVKLKIKKKSKGDKAISWKSSKKSVAVINSKGAVTAKKKGKTKIIVKMKSGCKATCTVTVK